MKPLDAGMVNTTEKRETISSPLCRMEFTYVQQIADGFLYGIEKKKIKRGKNKKPFFSPSVTDVFPIR